MYLSARNENSKGVVGGPLLVGRSGALASLPLQSGLAAERSRSKSQMSGAVSETPV